MNIFRAVYHIETWQLGDPFDEISNHDLIKVSEYLIMNATSDHVIPGAVWFQFLGIMDWYRQHGMITDKQRYWLMANLNKYLDQRDFAKEAI